MSTGDFTKGLQYILKYRSGIRNSPTQGVTNFGISQTLYNAYRMRGGKPQVPVTSIAPAEVADVYQTLYWVPSLADDVVAPVSFFLFDTAVEFGAPVAVKFLQQELQLTPDGSAGPVTRRALISLNNRSLAQLRAFTTQLVLRRKVYIRDIAQATSEDNRVLPQRMLDLRSISQFCGLDVRV